MTSDNTIFKYSFFCLLLLLVFFYNGAAFSFSFTLTTCNGVIGHIITTYKKKVLDWQPPAGV